MVNLNVSEKRAQINEAATETADYLCAHSNSWPPSTTRLTVGSVIYALEQIGYELTKRVNDKEGGNDG